jgi:hypothetical protein
LRAQFFQFRFGGFFCLFVFGHQCSWYFSPR